LTPKNNNSSQNGFSRNRIAFLFVIITAGFLIFVGTIMYLSLADRRVPKLISKETNNATRGEIVSSDGYTIARSKKIYKAQLDTRNIDPDKKELFVTLFSIYSGIDKKTIYKKLKKRRGSVILANNIDSKRAKHLIELSSNLFSLKVFKSFEDSKGRTHIQGLDILESGENRFYPYGDILTPVLGYINKIENNNITETIGIKGIERYYDEQLNTQQNGYIMGKRDVTKNIILNRESKNRKRIDGYDVYLNINIKLQKIIENILTRMKKELKAKEIMAAVMDSKSGNIIAIASSNRYNPKKITKRDYKNLNISAVEYIFEPGSVMKPITLSLLLKHKKVNPLDMVKTYNGRYKVGKKIIRDEHKYPYLSAEDIIVHSSNIGISILAQRLDGFEFYSGLKDFGFSQKSGIDLSNEHKGSIPSIRKLNSIIYKTTASYGYGLNVNFIQLLKAYNVFNNNGKLVEPKIASYFSNKYGNSYRVERKKPKSILPPQIAKRVQKILVKTVNEGTGKKAKIDGFVIGGKTGTAHIVKHGSYGNFYNSSFFGFANGKNNRFTIGVTVIEPKKKYAYFASLTAVPVFREIVENLIEEQYLKPVTKQNDIPF
jgi:cell division protein FtsI (penicillin-binding protein 3)